MIAILLIFSRPLVEERAVLVEKLNPAMGRQILPVRRRITRGLPTSFLQERTVRRIGGTTFPGFRFCSARDGEEIRACCEELPDRHIGGRRSVTPDDVFGLARSVPNLVDPDVNAIASGGLITGDVVKRWVLNRPDPPDSCAREGYRMTADLQSVATVTRTGVDTVLGSLS